MNRRDFLGGLASATALTCVESCAAVAAEIPLVVFFASSTLSAASRWIGFMQAGLKEQGYVEGQNYRLDTRFAEFQVERIPSVAKEVVRLRPAVILAGAVDTATEAKKATSTIPIVSGALADAVHLGLVASYSRPGGNVTGVTPYIDGLPAKQIEFVREILPGAVKIALVGNMNDPKAPPQRDELVAASRNFGITVLTPVIEKPEDIDGAIQGLRSQAVDMVIVLQTTMMLGQRQRLAKLVAEAGLPAVYGYREHVDEGGLANYGVDLSWCWRRVATYVQKILNGAAPGDLPIEFPPKIQMVVNLKTARALGLTVPRSMLARADEVIE
jgi:putative ABC transport system substrate-binding protein